MAVEIKFGRVSSVDKDRHTAQVDFVEVDGLVSYDLHVLARYAGDFALPPKDTAVACLLDEGASGIGVVLGVIYTESDEPPSADADVRAIGVGGDGKVRVGDVGAEDAAAKGPSTNTNFDNIKTHFDLVEAILTGPPINEPGNGLPSALQIALKAAIAGSPFPQLQDVNAEKVLVK